MMSVSARITLSQIGTFIEQYMDEHCVATPYTSTQFHTPKLPSAHKGERYAKI